MISPKKLRIPEKLDKHLRKAKYIVLALSVFMAWITLSLWLSPFDPWAAFSHIYKGEELLKEFFVGTILLAITIAASLFVSRPFCKYLCPAGALYGIIGKLSPFKIVRDSQKCIQCEMCTKKCPMDIEVHKMEKVTTAECISCSRCVAVCPGAGSMISTNMAGYKLKPLVAVIVSVVIFFGSISILDSVGLYKVSLPTQAEVIEKGKYIGISDLRGSMTIEQGAFYTGKELGEFYRIMKIPADVPKDTLLKYVYQYVHGYDFHLVKGKNGAE